MVDVVTGHDTVLDVTTLVVHTVVVLVPRVLDDGGVIVLVERVREVIVLEQGVVLDSGNSGVATVAPVTSVSAGVDRGEAVVFGVATAGVEVATVGEAAGSANAQARTIATRATRGASSCVTPSRAAEIEQAELLGVTAVSIGFGVAAAAARTEASALATAGVATVAAPGEATVTGVCLVVSEGERVALPTIAASAARGVGVNMLHGDEVGLVLEAGHD